MRRTGRALLVGGLAAVATHAALLLAIPTVVMKEVLRVAANRAGGFNRIDFAARVDDGNQIVPRSSTDFLYATCAYDLAAGPVAVAVPGIAGTHSVIALFDESMNNFHVAGDWGGERLGGVIVQAGSQPPAGAAAIVSPTRRGLVMVRVIVNDEQAAPAMDQARRATTCAPFTATPS